MRSKSLLFAAVIAATVVATPIKTRTLQTDAESTALTGRVSSAEEGQMEGVLVSAKQTGSIVTTTVVTDREGRYRFPASRLSPGQYALRIRAAGYDLVSTPAVASIRIAARKTATADLKLQKTRDLAAQLTNADWFASFPGTEAEKNSIRGCTHCHTLERIVRTNYDVDRLVAVIERMSTYPQLSFPMKIQKLPAPRIGPGPQSVEQRNAAWRRQA